MLHYSFSWLTVCSEMFDRCFSEASGHVTTGSSDIWIIRHLGCWGCQSDENWGEMSVCSSFLSGKFKKTWLYISRSYKHLFLFFGLGNVLHTDGVLPFIFLRFLSVSPSLSPSLTHKFVPLPPIRLIRGLWVSWMSHISNLPSLKHLSNYFPSSRVPCW